MGNGFPLRIGDQTVQVSESHISALKWQGMAESWESRPSDSKLDELDDQLLAKARQGAGLSALSDEEYLLRRKLADRRGREIVLRKAAELLFARLGPDHPNAGVHHTLTLNTGESGADAGESDADTGESDADTGEVLPLAIRTAIDQLGPRPCRERLRPLIHAICDQGRWVTSAELAELLSFRQHNLTAGHLAPMVESGQLERRFPGQPNHPRQAYRAVAQSPV